MDTPWERLSPRCRRRRCTGRRTRCTSATRTATAASAATTPRSRASCRSSSVGTRTPTATGPATSTRATCATCPVPSATAPGSSPRSSRVKLNDRSIAEVTNLSIGDASEWLNSLELGERERAIADLLKEIQARLSSPVDVGLDYLSLDRPAATLAGGEAQRIRPATTQIGSGLVGVLYVLDELLYRAAPAGQHPPHRDAGPAARHGQHADRRRARRGHDQGRRLDRRHRPRRG